MSAHLCAYYNAYKKLDLNDFLEVNIKKLYKDFTQEISNHILSFYFTVIYSTFFLLLFVDIKQK